MLFFVDTGSSRSSCVSLGFLFVTELLPRVTSVFIMLMFTVCYRHRGKQGLSGKPDKAMRGRPKLDTTNVTSVNLTVLGCNDLFIPVFRIYSFLLGCVK